MGAQSRLESGKAPSRSEGVPSRIRGALSRVAIGTSIAIASGAALLMGAAGLSVAIKGQAIAGMVNARPGEMIVAVSPTGFAWRDGIRPGQIVTDFDDGQRNGEWRLQTWDGSLTRVSTSLSADRALSASLPQAALGLALGCLSILFLRSRSWAVVASSLGLLFSSRPLEFQGDPVVSTVSLAASVLVPLVWLIARVPRMAAPRGAMALAGLVALLVSWAFARLVGYEEYGRLEAVRAGVAGLSVVAVILDVAYQSISRRVPIRSAVPNPRHTLFTVALAGLTFVPIHLGVAPVLVALLAIPVVVACVAIARYGGGHIERVLLSDLLNRASIEASERERARFASDLHDVPLQQLTGVIQRLDGIPGASETGDQLRALAEDLREMAVNQRPPVLDDLGLGAALEFVAERLSTTVLHVRTEVIDNTDRGPTQRPPSEVELAILRIVQEAAANAVRHAQATMVVITGDIAPGKVVVSIADDGKGLTPDLERLAARQGRLGLVSMRRRAQAVGARLSISASRSGTTVGVFWP